MRSASPHIRQPFFTQPVRLKPSGLQPVNADRNGQVKGYRDDIKKAFSASAMRDLDEDYGAAFVQQVKGLCAGFREKLKDDADAVRYLETRLQYELNKHVFAPNVAAALQTITGLQVRAETAKDALDRVIMPRLHHLTQQAECGLRLGVVEGFIQLQHKIFNAPYGTVALKQLMLNEIEESLLELSGKFPGVFDSALESVSAARLAFPLAAEISDLQSQLSNPVTAPGFAHDIGDICIDLATRIRAEDMTFQPQLVDQLIATCCAVLRDHSNPDIKKLMQHLLATGFTELPPDLDAGTGLVIHVDHADPSRN